MTIATVTTDINIGPFKIPSNGQNMIMNNYANRNNLIVELVIPEPMMSNDLATTQWLHKDYKFKHIILTSIHQLPQKKNKIKSLTKKLSKVTFHFALEGLSGSGKVFLDSCCKEARIFKNVPDLEKKNLNWIELHKLMKKSFK